MKKGILIISCCFAVLFVTFVFSADVLETVDSTNPNRKTVTGIIVSNALIQPAGVAGVTNSAGATDSNKVVKLNSSGLIDGSMLGAASKVVIAETNFASATGAASSYVFTNVASLTTTITNGVVVIECRAIHNDNTNPFWIEVTDGSTNVLSQNFFQINPLQGGGSITHGSCCTVDRITNGTKTYRFRMASNAANAPYTNYHATGVGAVNPLTNMLGMRIIQVGN